MIKIEFSGIESLRAELQQFSERRLNAAVATAMTRTAVQVRSAVQAEMTRVLDRPTPYTMRQMRYVAATAARPVAAVGFDISPIQDVYGNVVRYEQRGPGVTPAGAYMQWQIDGGQRRNKRMEEALRAAGALPSGWKAVPGQGARLDAWGNVSRGQVMQVLSQLRIELQAGATRNMSQNARKQIAAQRKAGGRFFVAKPGGALEPGVYQRELIGRKITPVFIFVRSAQYRRRLDFFGIANRVVADRLDAEMARAIGESAARMGGAS